MQNPSTNISLAGLQLVMTRSVFFCRWPERYDTLYIVVPALRRESIDRLKAPARFPDVPFVAGLIGGEKDISTSFLHA